MAAILMRFYLFLASYEIEINGDLVFSKLDTGKFPDDAVVRFPYNRRRNQTIYVIFN